jgi:hypothetical protein
LEDEVHHVKRFALLAIVAGSLFRVLAAVGVPSIVDLGVAARANAYSSLAAAGSQVAVAWGAGTPDGRTDVYAAISQDAGRTFAAPVRVSDGTGASLSGEQPPRIALVAHAGGQASIVVVWTAKAPAGTKLLSARSDDGGRTFSVAATIAGSDGPGNRGWESIAADGAGGVVAIWLDHRDLASTGNAAPTTHAAHQHGAEHADGADGAERAQLSKLFFGRVGSQSSAHSITGGVCYCCKTAVAVGDGGTFYAAWRHVFAGNVRDIAFSMSADGGRTFADPVRVSRDNWVLDGCPENGPSLAVDDRRRIHVVWPTFVAGGAGSDEPTLALFYAESVDGRVFSTRQQVPTEGVPRHAQVVAGSRGEILVAWDEQANGARRVVVARGTVDDGGRVRFARQFIDDGASYPVLARGDRGVLVASTGGPAGKTRIRVAQTGL